MFSSETMEIFDLSMIEKDVESEKKKKEENESVRYLGVVRLCLKLWMILRFLPFFYCLRCQKCHKYQVKVEKKYELIIYIHLKGA